MIREGDRVVLVNTASPEKILADDPRVCSTVGSERATRAVALAWPGLDSDPALNAVPGDSDPLVEGPS